MEKILGHECCVSQDAAAEHDSSQKHDRKTLTGRELPVLRLSLLWLFVAFFSVYAWRDWYKALCALVVLTAVVEHPDFPKSLLGLQGFNPWNFLLFSVTLAWLSAKKREGLRWDLPTNVNWYLIGYFTVIVIAFFRAAGSLDSIVEFALLRGDEAPSYAGLFSEQIINCFKWVVPGLLIFLGCNSEKRLRLAMLSVGLVYFLLAIQVIRWMPLGGMTGGDALAERSLKILSNEVGYHRVNLSMILAGASWAIFSARDLVTSKKLRISLYLVVCAVMLGQALTGGRMGYVTWMAIAMVFGLLKWRKILVLAPLGAAILISLVPAVQERLLQGFSSESINTNSRIEELEYREDDKADMYTVTAGRTFAWSFVIDEIAQAPIVGYGRQAMITTGIAPFLFLEYGEVFPHPHNAYLQWLLDNGLLGVIPVFLFFLFLVRMSIKMFRIDSSITCVAAAGFCLSLVLALLIAAMGSQTFYPREGAVGMWCAIGIMLRVYVQRNGWQKKGRPNSDIDGNPEFWRRPSGAEVGQMR